MELLELISCEKVGVVLYSGTRQLYVIIWRESTGVTLALTVLPYVLFVAFMLLNQPVSATLQVFHQPSISESLCNVFHCHRGNKFMMSDNKFKRLQALLLQKQTMDRIICQTGDEELKMTPQLEKCQLSQKPTLTAPTNLSLEECVSM